jgi:hypothetical protein
MDWLKKLKKTREDTVLDQGAGVSKPKSKKSKRNTGLGQDDEGLRTTSNASSAPPLVAAVVPETAVGTSTAASGSKQTGAHTITPSQTSTAATSPNVPTKLSQTETTRPRGQRIREGAIIALSFASIISEATDLLKPVKAISSGIKKVLEITKVCHSPLTLLASLRTVF